MWERLTPADIEQAKQRLAGERVMTLARHAAELEALTAEERQIEDLERLAGAFVEKYMSGDTGAAQTITPAAEEATQSSVIVEETNRPLMVISRFFPTSERPSEDSSAAK